MDDGICFSPGALALLGTIGAVLQGAIVTLFIALMKAKDAQIAKAEAREAEWKRVAVRGANDIIPSLATELRGRIRAEIIDLQGASEPGL